MADTQTAIELAQKALDTHRARRGLERDNEIVLIHLLADLIEYCDQNHIDLDASIESAREMIRDTAGT